jgi:hypothetical protein
MTYHHAVPPFQSTREAKDYLASAIAAAALRRGVALSETERKMLYYSESAWTLPDMQEVSAAFDEAYDDITYESKITGLIAGIMSEVGGADRAACHEWNAAVERLSGEDHYILVLIGEAEGTVRPLSPGTRKRPAGDFIKLVVTAAAVAAALMLAMLIAVKLGWR